MSCVVRDHDARLFAETRREVEFALMVSKQPHSSPEIEALKQRYEAQVVREKQRPTTVNRFGIPCLNFESGRGAVE